MKPTAPLPEDFAAHASSMTFVQLREHYGRGSGTISRWIRESKVSRSRTRSRPSDFAELAQTMTSAELRLHYRTSKASISQWRRECAIVTPRERHISAGTFKPTPVPENFRQVAPTLSVHAAKIFFEVGDTVLRRWEAEAGVRLRRQLPGRPRQPGTVINDTIRDMSRAGQAADFLRRFGPVARCDATGRYLADGFYWRRGSTVLSADEVIERAERNGWRADAWRQIPASVHYQASM
ncbi:hypothetical protein [Sphingomonas immobilis]|uniref:Uncharacterized protein n=1 Tax=Sphingomonas immobilis TaxID=3063997 RepID=A0ABT8ZU59_9SPHN|nr:hypothetical protein [Sphingomonas sp. CA1-15]MDO7841103.1 hypothetical protein [Sphingomonas sp. CA1-15]